MEWYEERLPLDDLWREKLEEDICPTNLNEKHMNQRRWDRWCALKRAGLVENVARLKSECMWGGKGRLTSTDGLVSCPCPGCSLSKPFVASKVPDSLEAWVDSNGGW